MRTVLAAAFVSLLMVGMCVSLPLARAADGSLTGLGTVGADARESFGRALSGDGQVAVGVSCCPRLDTAFRRDGAGMASLGSGRATAASGDGSVVVGTTAAGEAFRWTAASGITLLGAGLGSAARDISADGQVIVGTSGSGAFRWTQAGLVDLAPWPEGATGCAAAAVSDDGRVIVGRLTFPSGNQPFRWTAAGFELLGPLPAGLLTGEALAVSADGAVVVGSAHDATRDRAFRWTAAGGFLMLGSLSAAGSSDAMGVSDNGAVIVGTAQVTSGDTRPFIWSSAHGMRDLQVVLMGYGLDLFGWDLFQGNGVSADGRSFVGSGDHGNDEAWVARLPDAPETLELAVLLVSSFEPGGEIKDVEAAQSLQDWLGQAIGHLEVAATAPEPGLAARHRALARAAIRRALVRMDGCALRGAVDRPGAHGDWVLTCSAQAPIYGFLQDALLGF